VAAGYAFAYPVAMMRALTGWESLTTAELRVARLIAEGHTNRSAASVLALSANTVATHLRTIFGKIGVNSRVQLARSFLESGNGVKV
jgi:DNA-binding CsgD family transcriptional regulator